MMNMKHLSFMRLGAIALIAAALTACGGDDDDNNNGGGGGGGGGGVGTVNLSTPTAGDPNNAFTALTGIPLVTSASPTKVNFAVIGSNGQPVQGLTLFNAAGAGTGCGTYNARFALAKLVKGSGTAPDTWQNLISQVRSSGNPHGYVEGTTDPVPSATVPAGTAGTGTLTYNSAAGYYTYTFGTDVADAAYVAGSAVSTNKIFTNGNTLAKDGTTTYRVGMQLCYVDADGKTVISNPIYDFTMGSDGNSSTAAAMRKVVDLTSCNECHGNLAVHGGRRVDPNYCVLCHNPGSVDFHDENLIALGYPDGGAPIDLKYMVHKFHFGERLTKTYNVAGFLANEVTFPQDQTNCTKCHDNSKAANADNWKNVPSRNACGACHDGIDFATGLGTTMDPNSPFASLGHVGGAQADDTKCALCHSPVAIASVYHVPVTTIVGNSNVTSHYVSTANVSRMPAGAVTVDYEIKDVLLNASRNPVMVFRMLQSGVQTNFSVATGPTDTAMWPNFFGAPSVYFAYAIPQDGEAMPFDFNAYVNAGLQGIWNGSANTSASTTDDGTLTGPAPCPDGTAGCYTVTLTGRVIPAGANILTGALGYAAMWQTNVAGYLRTCPATAAANCSNGLNVPAQDVSMAASPANARRVTVEAARCNMCHEKLGIFAETVFHSGQRNDPKMCAMCHNPNRSSSGWSADSTSFVHAIHAAEKRTVPYNWHSITTAGPPPALVSSFAEVTYPGILENCLTCHAPGGYNFDSNSGLAQVSGRLYRTAAQGTMAAAGTAGALSLSPYVTAGANYGTNNSNCNSVATCDQGPDNLVNSPIANACFGCHDGDMASNPSSSVRGHIEGFGGSIYRLRGVAPTTDSNVALGRSEQCLICHGTTGISPIKERHGVE